MIYSKSILSLIVFLTLAGHAHACDCPKGAQALYEGKANKTFIINNTRLGLCGYSEISNGDTIFYESIVFNCQTGARIYEWYATQPCIVVQSPNKLSIKELYLIPNGYNFAATWQPFYITEINADDDSLMIRQYYVLNQNHYSKNEINIVLSKYQKTILKKNDWNSELYTDLARELLWAYISGSEVAERYLKQFENQFGPFDGAIAEDFNEIIMTYNNIKDIKK